MGREIELKLLLDDAGVKRLRAQSRLLAPDVRKLPDITLKAVYFDTPDHALARRGMALRLRREGRRWVQAVKAGDGPVAGLSTPLEAESPAPGGRLDLTAIPDAALRAAVAEAAADAPLAPVCETAIRRARRVIETDGAAVTLAIDVGEIRANGRAEPIREAELELDAGAPAALFSLAKALFPEGPLRLSRRTKAARGYALAAGERAVAPVPGPVTAAPVALSADMTAEAAAAAVLRGCLDQIAGNLAVVALSEGPEGPHQLRIGLRRLRTAASVFRPAVGCAALEALSAEARDLAAVVGAVRDLDVLRAEVVGPCAAAEPAAARLDAALAAARAEARDAAVARLAEPRTIALIFDLGAFVEGRGWLDPADFEQTGRLAEPVSALAERALDRRWRKAAKLGDRIAELDAEARHDLRKRLKKLRYTAEFFGDLWQAKRVRPFLRQLKALQDRFGGLQDAAMARGLLADPGARWADDPVAARAAGYALGRVEPLAEAEWARAKADWTALAETRRFWR